MKLKSGIVFFLFLLCAAGTVYAGRDKAPVQSDAAWDYYLKVQKQTQVAFHHLVRLHLHNFKDTVQQSLDLQLATADQNSERYYFLLSRDPSRIVRDKGFSAFVNFPWTPEDEALIAAEDKTFQKRQKQIDKLKKKLEGNPDYKKIQDKLAALSGGIEYQKIQSRFRYVPRDVETLLAGGSLPDADSSF